MENNNNSEQSRDPYSKFIQLFISALNHAYPDLKDLQDLQEKFSLADKHSESFPGRSMMDLLGPKVWEKIEPAYNKATGIVANSPPSQDNRLIDFSSTQYSDQMKKVLEAFIEFNRTQALVDQ